MAACTDIQKLLPVTPDSVSPEEYRRIIQHLETCPKCRELQGDFEAIDRASVELEIPDPGDLYWESFALRVRQGVAAGRVKESGRLVRWFVYRPAFSWPAAAAALLLVFFITRAMLPDGQAPTPEPVSDWDTAPTEKSGVIWLPSPVETSGEETTTLEPRAEPQTPSPDEGSASGRPDSGDESAVSGGQTEELAELAAEEVPRKSTNVRATGKTPSFEPDAVPAEEMEQILAAREKQATDGGPPSRKTIILRGDTVETQLSDKGLPRGHDLELAERPDPPFPVDDTISSRETERVLGSPIIQDYGGIPALNKDNLTPEDRDFFNQRIATLSEKLDAKLSDGKRREVCRELVDMYYYLAINWKVQADIEQALAFMESARKILPKDDYADLDAKVGALRPLLKK